MCKANIWSAAFKLCFQYQFAPLHPGHRAALLGGAVQVDSIQTLVESAPGVCNQCLRPSKCNEPLSNVAFNFKVRHYSWAPPRRRSRGTTPRSRGGAPPPPPWWPYARPAWPPSHPFARLPTPSVPARRNSAPSPSPVCAPPASPPSPPCASPTRAPRVRASAYTSSRERSPRGGAFAPSVTPSPRCLESIISLWQGLTLVHFLAQLERFVWDRGCTEGLCSPCCGGVRGGLGCVRCFCVRHGSG